MEITKEMSNFEPTNLSGASVGVDPDSWTDLFKSITANSVRDSSNYRGYYLIPLTDDEPTSIPDAIPPTIAAII